MSKFEEQVDDNNCICPYCKYAYQVECEDYSEDGTEEECGECGKMFWHEQTFSVSTHTKPNCALNDEEHDWQSVELRGNRFHDFCGTCGTCRPLTEAAS